MKTPTSKQLADALKDCIGAINDELSACGQDEVNQHPVLNRHQKIASKSEVILAKWEAAQ